MMSSCMHGEVLSDEDCIDLKLVTLINSRMIPLQSQCPIACFNCSGGNANGRMKTDHSLAPETMVVWPTTAPGAKHGQFPQPYMERIHSELLFWSCKVAMAKCDIF